MNVVDFLFNKSFFFSIKSSRALEFVLRDTTTYIGIKFVLFSYATRSCDICNGWNKATNIFKTSVLKSFVN